MTKAERIEYMRNRFPQIEESRLIALLPPTKLDVQEEIEKLDTFREHKREIAMEHKAMTSDEI